jgi:hypothetical protein
LTLIAALGAVVLLASATATGAQPRFQGYVGGAVTGKGHHFVVGDGLQIVFRDRSHAGTSYRVCWTGPSHDRDCWNRRTGARGNASRIGTDAPGHVGQYNVSWMVNDRVVARWWFRNGVGD